MGNELAGRMGADIDNWPEPEGTFDEVLERAAQERFNEGAGQHDTGSDRLTAKLEGALYAAMERGGIGYSSTQRRPAVDFLTPIMAELIKDARQQVAEQIAQALEAEARRHSVATAAMVLDAVAAPLARQIGAPDDECPSCHTRDGHPHTDYCKRQEARA